MSRANMIVLAEYEGMRVTFDDAGWFNATSAAKRFGKKPAEWLRLAETKKYVAALIRKGKVGEAHFARTVRGGSVGASGTWLHPRLAIRYAQWLDEDFAIWCDEQIERILKGKDAQTEEARRFYWGKRMELEVLDARSFAVASMSGKCLSERKRWLPKYRREVEALRLQMEPTLFEVVSA